MPCAGILAVRKSPAPKSTGSLKRLLKKDGMKNCEAFFRVTRRTEGVGSPPRLRWNEVRRKKGQRPQGRPSPPFGEAARFPAQKPEILRFKVFQQPLKGGDWER